jgi:hypothetical protein
MAPNRSLTWLAFLLVLITMGVAGCARKPPPPVQKTDLDMIGEPSREEPTTSVEPFSLSEATDEDSHIGGAPPRPVTSSRRSGTTISSAGNPRAELRSAAAAISNDLGQEKEDFFFKRTEETRRHFEDSRGDLLIPASSLSKVTSLLESHYPVDLKMSPEAMAVRLPADGGPAGERLRTSADLIGQEVEAIAERDDSVPASEAAVAVLYQYSRDAGPKNKDTRTYTVRRKIHYQSVSKGKWVRTRVEEEVVGETGGETSSKPASRKR